MPKKPIKRGAAPRRSVGGSDRTSKMSMGRKITRDQYAAREIITDKPSRDEQVAENKAIMDGVRYNPDRDRQVRENAMVEHFSQMKPIRQSNKRGSESGDPDGPVVTTYFSADLITSIIPQIGTAGTFTRGSGAHQTDYKPELNFVVDNVPRHWGARLDPDGVTYYDTQDDGTTPIDPATLLGVMVEGAGTNAHEWSELFTGWGISGAIVGTDQVTDSPLGHATLWEDQGQGNSANCNIFQSGTFASGVESTASMFVKAGLKNWFNISFEGDTTKNTWFDLSTGTIGTDQNASSGIEAWPNGWYRCWITGTAIAGNRRAKYGMSNADGTLSCSRNNDSSMWMVGGVTEPGPYPTTYIYSDSDTGSRAFEALQYPVAGNLPVNDFELTFDFTPFDTDRPLAGLWESRFDGSNYTRIYTDGAGNVRVQKRVANVDNNIVTGTSFAALETVSIRFVQKSDTGMELFVNDVSVGTNANTDDLVLGTTFEVGNYYLDNRGFGCFREVEIKGV